MTEGCSHYFVLQLAHGDDQVLEEVFQYWPSPDAFRFEAVEVEVAVGSAVVLYSPWYVSRCS